MTPNCYITRAKTCYITQATICYITQDFIVWMMITIISVGHFQRQRASSLKLGVTGREQRNEVKIEEERSLRRK